MQPRGAEAGGGRRAGGAEAAGRRGARPDADAALVDGDVHTSACVRAAGFSMLITGSKAASPGAGPSAQQGFLGLAGFLRRLHHLADAPAEGAGIDFRIAAAIDQQHRQHEEALPADRPPSQVA
jgi:hypothetical protein